MSQFKCGYHSRVILWVPEGCTGLPYLASLSLPVHGSSMCCFHGTRAAFWSRAGRAAQQEWKWGFLVPADEMATNRNQQGWTSRSQAQLITPVQKGALVETAATKYINKQTSNTSIPSAPAPNSQCISCSSRWAEQHCMLLQAPAGAAQLLFAQSWIALRIKSCWNPRTGGVTKGPSTVFTQLGEGYIHGCERLGWAWYNVPSQLEEHIWMVCTRFGWVRAEGQMYSPLFL